MKILDVVVPLVIDAPEEHAETLSFYRDVLGLPERARFEHAGFRVTSLQQLVFLEADAPAALTIPRQVIGIFLVDDLASFWARLATQAEPLVEPEDVPTGRRFVVRHPDGRVFEYLQLSA